MKRLLLRLLQPIFSSPTFALRFKDAFLSHPAEHLYRTRNFVRTHQLSKTGSLILDIGAAEGNTAHWFAKNFPNHQVIAFEPVKASYERARDLNKNLSNVSVHNLALADKAGTATMHVSNNLLSSSLLAPGEITESEQQEKMRVTREESCDLQRLDDFLKDRSKGILLMKLDTQGSELQVLQGARDTLSRTSLVLVEMSNHSQYQHGTTYYEVDAFLRSQNFSLVDIFITYRPKGLVSEYDALYKRNGS